MARLVFPDDPLVYTIEDSSDFRPAIGRKVKVYANEGLTQLADIRNLDGTPVAGSELIVDNNSLLPLFLGPENNVQTLYVASPSGAAAVINRYDTRAVSRVIGIDEITGKPYYDPTGVPDGEVAILEVRDSKVFIVGSDGTGPIEVLITEANAEILIQAAVASAQDDHTHAIYAITDHTHPDSATAGHTHSSFAPLSHSHTDGSSSGSTATVNFVDKLEFPHKIAHRGYSIMHPENSLESFDEALARGCSLENDVMALADGTLVIHHDTTVDRMHIDLDGNPITGNVNSFTLAQWRTHRVKPVNSGRPSGTPMTFIEWLNRYGGKVPLVIEIKAGGVPVRDAIVAEVKARGLEKAAIIISFSQTEVIYAAQQGCTAAALINSGSLTALDNAGVWGIDVSLSATSAFISEAKALGFRVIGYTFNTVAQYEQAIALGITDGFTSDDADWITGQWSKGKQATLPISSKPSTWPGWNVGTSRRGSVMAFGAEGEIGWPSTTVASQVINPLGKRSVTSRLRVTLRYGRNATAQDRWGAIDFATAAPDISASDAAAGIQGYRALLRRNGSLELFRFDPGVAPSNIGAMALTGVGITNAGSDRTHTLEVEVSSTSVTVRHLETGQILTAEDVTYRTATYWGLASSGNESWFSNLHCVDL